MLSAYQKRLLFVALNLCFCVACFSQRFLSDYDSTLFLRDTVSKTFRRFENLHIGGYMQPQYQAAERQGIATYEGPAFSARAANRFLLRRARVKIDYILPSEAGNVPKALFTFQFEATERDLNIRDMFVRLYEPKGQKLSVTAGLFARPFGYEVNLSSGFRESPERGRLSQILVPSERDLGAMATYDAKARDRLPVKFDIGVFNGQGKSGPAEFDSYKDLISRLTLKPQKLSRNLSLTAGLSFLRGGWLQATRYRYQTETVGESKMFVVDSSLRNEGSLAPRHYYGADAQLVLQHRRGKTEWRAEIWSGTQPGTATTTVNPGTLPTEPTYIRRFRGGFLYFLQNIGNEKWEAIVKWDWYDPNRDAKGYDIGATGSNLTEADVRYGTLGLGLTHYVNANIKAVAYYAVVRNETTERANQRGDVPDDVFTLRLQFRF